MSNWKMVPVEPTDEMIVAFVEAWYSKRQTIDEPEILDAYRDMLATAPDFPAEERSRFEMLFPVPFWAIWDDKQSCYVACEGQISTATDLAAYNSMWKVWQARSAMDHPVRSFERVREVVKVIKLGQIDEISRLNTPDQKP